MNCQRIMRFSDKKTANLALFPLCLEDHKRLSDLNTAAKNKDLHQLEAKSWFSAIYETRSVISERPVDNMTYRNPIALSFIIFLIITAAAPIMADTPAYPIAVCVRHSKSWVSSEHGDESLPYSKMTTLPGAITYLKSSE